jgi:hypothetical protein
LKIAIRILVFASGAGLLFFGWHKAHNEILNLQNPASPNPTGSSEVLVVIGAFVALMAFLPSSETLGRWMSLKRHKAPAPAHFRRRRQKT